MTDPSEIPDRIEREIQIDAPIERVWRLVNEPGWWIGDGDRSQQVVTHKGDDLVIVADPKYGTYSVLRVSADAPHEVTYRGGDDPAEVPAEGSSSLVEFFLTEKDGGTLLRVVESGFAGVYPSPDERATAVEGNIAGWIFQLDVAKQHAEHVSA